MPECRYCDGTFEGDEAHAEHLGTAHEREELSRIDRNRVEVLLPAELPEAETEPEPIDTADLDTLLERHPTWEGILQALAEHERVVRKAERNDVPSYANDLFWQYYEPLATHLDAVVRADGWPVLADLMNAYDPAGDAADSPAPPVIGNAIGRYLIRTRPAEGVAGLPEDGLAYLFALRDDEADLGWDEAAASGWGIGHPSHPVADRLYEIASDDPRWVTSALEQAFYADQHAACDCLARIVRDGHVANERSLFTCVVTQNQPEHWPGIPPYLDWTEDVSVTFEWDDTVVSRIEELVAEAGIERDLPDEWSLIDLTL